MNRKTLASLSISLGLTLFVMGSLPLAASDTPNVALAITETPVATETSTPVPTNTPVPTPTPTNTPSQAPTNARVEVASTPTPTSTPTGTSVLVLPITGAPAEPIDDWFVGLPAILALIVGGFGAFAAGWIREGNVTRKMRERTLGSQENEHASRTMSKD